MKKGEIYKSLEKKRRVIIFVSFVAVLMLWIFQTEHSLVRTIGTLLTLCSFYLVDHLAHVNFKPRHYAIVIFMAFVNFPLGDLYVIYSSFDKFMHFFLQILLSSLIFFMVSKLKIKLKWKIVFTFFIVAGLIGLWEVGEYALDLGAGYHLQGIYDYSSGELVTIQTPIDDTMIDLSLGVAGTLTYLIFIIIYSTRFGEKSVGYRSQKKH